MSELHWLGETDLDKPLMVVALKGLFDRKGLDPELFGAYDRKGAEGSKSNEK